MSAALVHDGKGRNVTAIYQREDDKQSDRLCAAG